MSPQRVPPSEIEAVFGDLLQWTTAPSPEADARLEHAAAMQPASGRAQALIGLMRARQSGTDAGDPRSRLIAAAADPDWLTQYDVATGLARLVDAADPVDRARIVAAATRALDVVQCSAPRPAACACPPRRNRCPQRRRSCGGAAARPPRSHACAGPRRLRVARSADSRQAGGVSPSAQHPRTVDVAGVTPQNARAGTLGDGDRRGDGAAGRRASRARQRVEGRLDPYRTFRTRQPPGPSIGS